MLEYINGSKCPNLKLLLNMKVKLDNFVENVDYSKTPCSDIRLNLVFQVALLANLNTKRRYSKILKLQIYLQEIVRLKFCFFNLSFAFN